MKTKFKFNSISNFNSMDVDSNAMVHRKFFDSQIALQEGEEKTIIAKISTMDVDRDGEMLIPEGCDTSEFEKNAIVLWNHSYSEAPIGKIVAMQKTKDAILAKIVFADTTFANEIWSLVKGGFLSACSIGFVAKRTLIRGTQAFTDFVYERGLEIADTCNAIISEFTMIENSMVPLPCNPNALITAIASKSINLDDKLIKELGLNEQKGDTNMEDVQVNEGENEQIEEVSDKVVNENVDVVDEEGTSAAAASTENADPTETEGESTEAKAVEPVEEQNETAETPETETTDEEVQVEQEAVEEVIESKEEMVTRLLKEIEAEKAVEPIWNVIRSGEYEPTEEDMEMAKGLVSGKIF